MSTTGIEAVAREAVVPGDPPSSSAGIRGWLLDGTPTKAAGHLGPHVDPAAKERGHHWSKVMCLTGVDYFSTLGYQPGIAALAAGAAAPIATLVLVALTVFGALPVYRRVAWESPHGQGSIAVLERLLPAWKGKLFVIVLLGFAATDFLITMTLSAADATEHLTENPLIPVGAHHHVLITLALLGLLGAIFLKGFREAIGIAVALVAAYLLLNAVVIAVGRWHVAAHPVALNDWRHALTTQRGDPFLVIAFSLIVFLSSPWACPASRPVWR